jgi:hypothetical protein
MDPGAVRFSIGLEDSEDLIADVHQALDALAGRGNGAPYGTAGRQDGPGRLMGPRS